MGFELIMTLDYELPAGGCGDVRRHMIRPTARLLEVCEDAGAHLTIMVEIGELWAFEDRANAAYAEALGYDPAREIREQLADAIARGHDVQLHLHPQWLGARWDGGAWRLDYAHYRLSDLPDGQAAALLGRARCDLEALLRPHRPAYACLGFRAGHWSTFPTDRYLAVLREAGLRSDCSVFKWGHADGAARFDYRAAASNALAWITSPDDLNRAGTAVPDAILEVPIATRLAGPLAFLKPRRLGLAWDVWRESRALGRAAAGSRGAKEKKAAGWARLGRLFRPRPLKLDFCKMGARELLAGAGAIMAEHAESQAACPMPLLMIGHSKQPAADNVAAFLTLAHERFGSRVAFSTYQAFVEKYAAHYGIWEGVAIA